MVILVEYQKQADKKNEPSGVKQIYTKTTISSNTKKVIYNF